MDATKQRRLLTETDLFTLLESTEAELLEGAQQLDKVATKILDTIYEPGTFADLVKQKRFKASTVLVDDQPAFILVYTINALGWLTVEGAVALGKAPLSHAFNAADALARHYHCKAIQFVTKLKALWSYGSNHGYKSLGIIMCKNAPPH